MIEYCKQKLQSKIIKGLLHDLCHEVSTIQRMGNAMEGDRKKSFAMVIGYSYAANLLLLHSQAIQCKIT